MFIAWPFSVPLTVPYDWSKGTHHNRSGVLVWSMVDGAIGWGEATPPPDVQLKTGALVSEVEAAIAVVDATSPSFLDDLDDRGFDGPVRAALSSAWMTAKAAAAGHSLSGWMGEEFMTGACPAAQVPVNELVTEQDIPSAVARVYGSMKNGITTYKVKLGQRSFDDDYARVAALRKEFSDITLRLDPNEAWKPDMAPKYLDRLAQFTIEYVEQPLDRSYSLDVHATLRKQSSIPIALDQSVTTLQSGIDVLNAGAADVLIIKPQMVGGPDRAISIAQRGYADGVKTTITGNTETAIGLMVSLHCGALLAMPIPACGIGTARLYAWNVGAFPEVEQGVIAVPETPGLGIEVWGCLSSWTEEPTEAGTEGHRR